jgi:DnaJ family protein C protein 8
MERVDRMLMEAAARAAPAGPSRPVDGASSAADSKDQSVASTILKHIAGGDIFSALLLPAPGCDDAGRPVWTVTDSEISKAFRKRSLAVHPDKNPSPEAKDAFDKLNDAIRTLRDPVKKGEALRKFADRVFTEKCRLDPTLTNKARKEQEKTDASDFGADIVRQQQEHRARVETQRLKQRQRNIRRRKESDDEVDALLDESSESDHTKPKEAHSKRKRGGSSSDSDSAGLARPVLGARGGRGRGCVGRGPRFIM